MNLSPYPFHVVMSLKVELSGHAKAVTCISVEPAGNRLVTGSLDYAAKMFDFGGMDRLIHN
jgi:WD40 repeat protein